MKTCARLAHSMSLFSSYLTILGVFVLHFATATNEVSDPVLDKKLKWAEEMQDDMQEAGTVLARLIKEAPEATLNAGTGDVLTTGFASRIWLGVMPGEGNCAGDIYNFCSEIKAGMRRLADCLSKQLAEEEKGNVQGRRLTVACKKELADFRIDRKLAKDDAAKLCTAEDPTDPGAILPCLRRQNRRISKPCAEEVFKTQLEAAKDFRTDANLYAACGSDARALCADVKAGEGRIQACLRDQQAKLSWECQEELFRQEVENADNIMLSYRLMRKCMGDKKKFCPDVEPGNARVKDCLEENRNKEDFSPEYLGLVGYPQEGIDNTDRRDSFHVFCLANFKDELTSEKCKEEVHKFMMRAFENIRFNFLMSESCYPDRQRLCAGYLPGSARVIRCLQDHREELEYDCQVDLFRQEIKMSEHIDFKYPMKAACTAEINKFCGTVQKGEARVIQCLHQHVHEADVSWECKREIEWDMLRSSQDYRLNYRLARACEGDRQTLCGEVCQESYYKPCGGSVLQCLARHYHDLQSPDCQIEVLIATRLRVPGLTNTLSLA
eukprot:jgi/Botrbrau1/18920/Bobra.177_2s0074.1